jgi:hypothetical protein
MQQASKNIIEIEKFESQIRMDLRNYTRKATRME